MFRLPLTSIRFFSKEIRCIILHPVSFPNKGPIIQQYLAEEALGLAKSIGWTIIKGPFWNRQDRILVDLNKNTRKRNELFVQGNADEIQDGDYIKTSLGNGFLQGDGIVFDQEASESDGDLYQQWRDKILRESLANSSLTKVRRITKKIFFTKGKLAQIAQYLRRQDFDCLYINAQLKPTQVKNLKKFIEARLNNVSMAEAYPQRNDFDSQTEYETEQGSPIIAQRNMQGFRKVNIFDRFSVILQIFAKRTTSKLARLQVELSYLTYMRTRLVRQGAIYLATSGSFTGDLLGNVEQAMEVISARQRKAGRSLGGQGQSQLEIQRRRLRDREAEIRRNINEQARLRKIFHQKQDRRGHQYPIIALVGYTNVGKSAFMNALMKKKQVESKDLLFQTLHTTSRTIMLGTGTKINLLDTIGFITNLPVQMVQAFKSTLQEIAHADLVIHLRDCSHPHHDLQKDSVIKILQQMGFGQAFQKERMLQVWNKVDLVSQVPEGLSISCLTGRGMKDLFTLIEQKLKQIKGQELRVIQYGLQRHGEVLNWLRQNTNHSFNFQTQYNYETSHQFPNGSVKIKVSLDQAAIGKLNKFINPNKPKSKGSKGMPPKSGW